MSFVVPEASRDQLQVDRAIEALRLGFSERGIALDVSETRLSREAALDSEDVRPLVPDGAEWMTFYELFVPTPYYWKASGLAETILGELRRREDAG
jgi:hypothetical protein